jgi:DMSO/TMAO reductase YedYZ molybdopterin-dependent catalytic subunit
MRWSLERSLKAADLSGANDNRTRDAADEPNRGIRRRALLRRAAWTALALWQFVDSASAQSPTGDGDVLVGTLPLGRLNGRPAPPMGTLLGTGLDARQFADLSRLDEGALVTATPQFYVRTAAVTDGMRPSRVVFGGGVRRKLTLTPAEVHAIAQPSPELLMECAGNTDPANFGLMSVAHWTGAPLLTLVDRVSPHRGGWRVMVTGVDPDAPSRSSQPGASWIFSRDELERAGAMLVTGMNGTDLPPDHGAPIRLIVPGWYGCASIKWVSGVDLVPDDAAATSQMQEFASRTHQQGMPTLAREFEPAVIDLAATPVRVEQWRTPQGLRYRVIGIMWGGNRPTNRLTIRFKSTEPFVPVEHCPLPASTKTWTLWWHTWAPRARGRYQIVLRVDDPAIRTRRLDSYFYTREVEIQDVATGL